MAKQRMRFGLLGELVLIGATGPGCGGSGKGTGALDAASVKNDVAPLADTTPAWNDVAAPAPADVTVAKGDVAVSADTASVKNDLAVPADAVSAKNDVAVSADTPPVASDSASAGDTAGTKNDATPPPDAPAPADVIATGGTTADSGGGGGAGGSTYALFPDRMTDWSHAGVVQPDGTRAIPKRTSVCATVDATKYGDGKTDATAAIQAAIDACPDDQVVSLPAGAYVVKNAIGIKHPIVLRGAGAGATKIVSSASINISATPGTWPGQNTLHAVDWTGGLDKGSTTITLADASGIMVGQPIVLDQLNDSNVTTAGYTPLVSPVGNEGTVGVGVNDCASRDGLNFCTDGSHAVPRALMQIVQVKTKSGNQVTIDAPVHITHLPSLSPQAFYWDGGNLAYAGIESLTIDAQYNDQAINMTFCSHCWVKGVEIDHIARGAVALFYDLHAEIRDSYFHMNQASAPENYGLEVDDTSQSLFENNILDALAAGIIVSWSSSGNVISYNYSVNDSPGSQVLGQTLSNHSVHAFMNLWEGNTVPKFVSDAIWGSASHQTLFRNRISGYMEPSAASGSTTLWSNGNWPIALEAWHRDFNLIGNVLGKSEVQNGYQAASVADGSLVGATGRTSACACCTCGMGVAPIYVLGYWNHWHPADDTDKFDPLVASTLLRWGNFDAFSNSTHWDGTELAGETAPADHVLPASLYLPGKPSWFGATAWPPIGPDASPMAQKLPAQLCYESSSLSGGGGFDPSVCYP